jgi:hypothetical protein
LIGQNLTKLVVITYRKELLRLNDVYGTSITTSSELPASERENANIRFTWIRVLYTVLFKRHRFIIPFYVNPNICSNCRQVSSGNQINSVVESICINMGSSIRGSITGPYRVLPVSETITPHTLIVGFRLASNWKEILFGE